MPAKTTTFEDAIAIFDRDTLKKTLAQADADRAEFLRRFPRDHWPELRLEDYVLGIEEQPETYCRWIEFKTRSLGSIAGGAARKLLISKRKNEPGWYHAPEYANQHDAWTGIRAGFVRALDLAEADDWDAIGEKRSHREWQGQRVPPGGTRSRGGRISMGA